MLAAQNGVLPADWSIRDALEARGMGWWALLVPRALSVGGGAIGGSIVAVIIAAIFWRWLGWRPAVLVAAATSVALAAVVVKALIDRPRPPGALLTDPGFPSGHTSFATAVLGVAAVILAHNRQRTWAWACVVVIVLMGPARIAVGAHWASDVVGGYLLGITWLCAILAICWPWWAAGATRAPSGASRGTAGG